jgi:hypothetical protein
MSSASDRDLDDAPTRDPDPTEILLTGRPTPPAVHVALVAGPVTCLLEGVDLRHVRLGEVELVNLVFPAVRDVDWNTIPGHITELQVDSEPDHFRVGYVARHRSRELVLTSVGTISGSPDGRISYTLEMTADSSFHYRRLGFNLLLAADLVAGRSTRGWDAAGHVVFDGQLPISIASQPERDGRLTGMLPPFTRTSIQVEHDLAVDLRFDGDEFEVEDQRLFADSSFKIYATPLQRPAPFVLRRGETLSQRVEIGALPRAGSVVRSIPPRQRLSGVELELLDAIGWMPSLGFGSASDGVPLDEVELDRLRALRPSHLRVAFDPGPAGKERFDVARREARELGARLEVEVLLPSDLDAHLEAGIATLGDPSRGVEAVLVRAPSTTPVDSGPPADLVESVRSIVTRKNSTVVVGGAYGTLAALTRYPIDIGRVQMASLAISPTVHRADDETVMENLDGLRDQVRHAIAWVGGDIRIGPVTLATIDGPYPGGPRPPGDLPPQVDARQPSLFAAAWLVGAIGELGASGARAITLFETSGWRGIQERTNGCPLPARFLSQPGTVYPTWHVLADIAEWREARLLEVQVADPVRLGALALERQDGTVRLLVANRTRDPVPVTVRSAITRARSRILDAVTANQAMHDPKAHREQWSTHSGLLALGAYAVATLDLERN